MYYIRLSSGDEKTYRTVDEIVWDVELGVITRDAMIFHPTTKTWVQITRHPQVGTRFVAEDGSPGEVALDFDLLSEEEVKNAAPKSEPVPAPSPEPTIVRSEPEFVVSHDNQAQSQELAESRPTEALAAAVEFLAPIAPTAVEPPPLPPPAAAAEFLPEPPPLDGELMPLVDDGGAAEYKPLDWKPEPRFRGVALILGALLLVGLVGAGAWFGWRWWSSRTVVVVKDDTDNEPATPGDTVVARQAVDSVSDRELAAAIALLAVAETAGTGTRTTIIRPGRLIPGAQPRAVEGLRPMTPSELRRSYTAAYANARSAMDSDLALGGVARLFSNARLTSRDSLRSGRRLITAAINIVRAYHADEVQIERAFRDTVSFQVSRMGWTRGQQSDWKSRATLKESYDGSQLTDSLLIYTDNLYALLLGNWGEYEISGSSIAFDDPKTADEYAPLADWLNNRITQLDNEAESTASSPSARRLARALGGTRPPTLRRSRVPD